MTPRRVVVLGCGYAGLAVARAARARGDAVAVHTRRAERAAELAKIDPGFVVWQLPALDAETVGARMEAFAIGEDILTSYGKQMREHPLKPASNRGTQVSNH